MFMKINHVECINLLFDYPGRRGFESSGGITTSRVTSLVLVLTDGGEVGIGSAYSHPALVQVVVQQLSDLLQGADVQNVEAIWEKMYGWTRWFGRKGAAMSALGGIDVALWDLRGKLAGKPVWQLLGGTEASCPAYASALLWNTFDGLAAEATRHLERGLRRMKMRLGRDEDYDIRAVQTVRKAIGPQHDLMCDASMRYHLALARRMGQTFADNRVFWFEEPFPPEDLDSFAALRSTVAVPIAAGENEFGAQGFRELIERRAVDIVQADASRCGGITELRRVADMTGKAGLKLAPHSWSDAVAIMANAHVVAATPHALTVEVDQTGNPFVDDLLVEPLFIKDGRLQLSNKPGLGVELNLAVVDRLRMADPMQVPDGWYSDMVFGQKDNRPAGAYRERA
jgi:D-galactarolactone cycloisomerase